MTTIKLIEMQSISYHIPPNVKSDDPSVTLPIEVLRVQDSNWRAVYDGHPDVEYNTLWELCKAHAIDLTEDDLEEFVKHTCKVDVEVMV